MKKIIESNNVNEKLFKLDKYINLSLILALLFFILGIILILFGNAQKMQLYELGDFLSGTTGILWSFSGVLLIVSTFILQRQQFHVQSEELKLNIQNLEKQNSENQLNLKMEIHSKFQSEMRVIQRSWQSDINDYAGLKFDKTNYNALDFDENGNYIGKYKRPIEIYWYFVFDEWFTCMKGGEILKSLWTEHYRFGAKSALKNLIFRKTLENMLERENSFLGMANEFENELNKMKTELKNNINHK
jgi:hypothetical protein